MEFGIHLVQQNTTLTECRDLWRWADTAGFTWIDVSDHFYESPMTEKQGPYLECLACLAALAADTERVRVGTCVLAMDYRHPAVLANALATIDHLSNGRLDAGLGAGWNVQEYTAYGIPFDRIGGNWTAWKKAFKCCARSGRNPEPTSTVSTTSSTMRSVNRNRCNRESQSGSAGSASGAP